MRHRSLLRNQSDLGLTEDQAIEAKIKECESFEAKLSFMRITATRDLYTVLAPDQRKKQNALRHRMRQTHRARMFGSQGMDTTDQEPSTEGMTPVIVRDAT
jgi:Spy/CpxP family protein refolding chaperone